MLSDRVEQENIGAQISELTDKLRAVDAQLKLKYDELSRAAEINHTYTSLLNSDGTPKIFTQLQLEHHRDVIFKLAAADGLLKKKITEFELIENRITKLCSGEEIIQLGTTSVWDKIYKFQDDFTRGFQSLDQETRDLHTRYKSLTGIDKPFTTFVVDGEVPLIVTPSFTRQNDYGVKFLEDSAMNDMLKLALSLYNRQTANNEQLLETILSLEEERKSEEQNAESRAGSDTWPGLFAKRWDPKQDTKPKPGAAAAETFTDDYPPAASAIEIAPTSYVQEWVAAASQKFDPNLNPIIVQGSRGAGPKERMTPQYEAAILAAGLSAGPAAAETTPQPDGAAAAPAKNTRRGKRGRGRGRGRGKRK